MNTRVKLTLLAVLYTAIVGGIGYRLGYEQNPCSALEIVLSYPMENAK